MADEIVVAAEVVAAERNRIAVIQKACAASVGVFGQKGQGGGSGVVITPDGFALTNFHVIQGNGPFMKCSMPDGVLYDAVIVGIDPVGDVAMIKLLGREDFPVAEIGDSDQLRQGDYCFAVGNPFLLATNFQPTVTWGIVSGVHRYQYPAGTLLEYTDCVQTDAAINPGNSGGPLFNADGQLVGINGRGSFEKRGRVNVGVGYAISINQIKYFLHHLLAGRLVDHATLGATVATNERGEVRVSNILESSDAYRRGLRFDDQLIAFAGRDIQTVNQFKNILGIFPKGWRVPLSFRRDGQRYDLLVRLAGVHASDQLVDLVQGSSSKLPQIPEGNPKPKRNETPSPEQAGLGKQAKKHKYQHLFHERPGYANFHFNLENRRRVWTEVHKHGDFSVQPEPWRIRGQDERGNAFTMVLGDETSGLQFRNETYLVETDRELFQQAVPQSTGGMLLALHLWRQLLIQGPDRFDDASYFGRLPRDQSGRLADVITLLEGVVELAVFVDPDSGYLVALEMSPDTGVDPCVLRFSEYQRHDDLTVPQQIAVEFGNDFRLTIELDQIEFVADGSEGKQ